MKRPINTRFFAQQMIVINQDEILGCFLDKQQLELNWFHEKPNKKNYGKTYQVERALPKYQVEHPLLCYDGPYPDSRELTIVNMADTDGARSKLKLQNLKLITFVEHRDPTYQTKVCFLAYDYSQKKDQKNL